MIGIVLQGNLGNQLFQYAFAYSVSKKLKTKFYIDQSLQLSAIHQYFKLPEVNGFLLKPDFQSNYYNVFSLLKKKWLQYLTKNFTSNELTFDADTNYADVVLKIHNNVVYKGYFQSEHYFKDYEPKIKKAFRLKKHLIKSYQHKYCHLFKEKKIVTVHIRKTDYLKLGHLNLGGDDLSLPLSYYHRILADIQVDNSLIIFISDDVDLVKREFAYLNNKLISDDSVINDFQHLLNADICIIANSTFSWWGAWLNSRPNKKIYAPQYFMGHRINITWPPEIYPAEWNIVALNEFE